MNATRRLLLAGSALALPLALAACPGTNVSTLAADVATVDNAVATFLSNIPNVPAVISSGLTTVANLAKSVTGTTGTTAQQLWQAAQELLPAAEDFVSKLGPIGTLGSMALSAIAALVPEIVSLAGGPVLTGAVLAPTGMTAAQARKLFGAGPV